MTGKHVVIVIAALGLASFLCLRALRPPVEAAAKPQAQEELAQLRAELASLRRSVNSGNLRGLRALAVDDSAEERPPVSHDQAVEPGPAEARVPSPDEAVENLEQHFAEETVGGAEMQRRRSAADQDLRRALGSSSRLESLSCKQTLCRATLSHNNLAAFRSYSEEYARPGQQFPGVSSINLEGDAKAGTVRSVIFLAESAEQLAVAAQTPEE